MRSNPGRVPSLVIAGGGTGGHVFPGFAIAAAAGELAEVQVTFVGTARGLEARVPLPPGHRLELLDVEPMKGGGVTRAVRGAGIAAVATVSAVGLLRRLAPRAVLSVGGYAAGPVALAAAMLRIPLAIFEPNAAMGLANRMVAPFAQRAYLALVESIESERSWTVRPSSVRIFGVPLRDGFRPSLYRVPAVPAASAAPAASTPARVLVLGGSQGAAALNERLPEAIGRAVRELAPSGRTLEVLHQAGKDREASVRNAYLSEKVENATVVPFIEDVAEAITRADIIVARAGAGSIAEIAAIGRASILVPFPFAADDHQAKNAGVFSRAGGCVAIRQEAADATRLGSELTRLLGDDEARTRMADAARAFGRPDAARAVAEDLLRLGRMHVEPGAARTKAVNGVSHPPNGRGNYRRTETS